MSSAQNAKMFQNICKTFSSVPLLSHSMGQITKSLASFRLSVCLSALLRSQFLLDFGLKSKKIYVWVKIRWFLPYFGPIFQPRNVFPMGRSKYLSNKAHGPIVAVKSYNDVPREWLWAQIESAYAISYWSSVVTLVLSYPFRRYCRFPAENYPTLFHLD